VPVGLLVKCSTKNPGAFLTGNLKIYNKRETLKKVHEVFSSYNKDTSKPKVIRMIQNTTDFTIYINKKYSKDFIREETKHNVQFRRKNVK